MTSYTELMPGGCLVIGSARDVRFANEFFLSQYGYDTDMLIGRTLETLLTPASRIFYDSYVEPTLQHTGLCHEVELTFVDSNFRRYPVVANLTNLPGDDPVVIWCIINAEKRDNAYQELIGAREELRTYATQLQELASTDPLTGLNNRREFERRSLRDFVDADRAGHSVAIVLVDIDHFKSVNDRFGHVLGDSVLRQIGQTLLASCRKQDTVARYGGDEFICCLYDIDVAGAKAFAMRVQSAITEAQSSFTTVTVSVGISLRNPENLVEIDTVIQQADLSLYAAKCAGRNRIIVHGETELPSA